jgi:hypothetical protein
MELKGFIQLGLDRARQVTMKAIDGMTYDEMKWRPGPGANSIGIIFFHQARFEDICVQSRIQGKPQVWEMERWYKRLNMSADNEGAHYTVEQVNAFRVPEPKELSAYSSAVRDRTVEYLHTMTADQFDRLIKLQRGEVSISSAFAFIVVHTSEHAGDISYLRGLQRGLGK